MEKIFMGYDYGRFVVSYDILKETSNSYFIQNGLIPILDKSYEESFMNNSVFCKALNEEDAKVKLNKVFLAELDNEINSVTNYLKNLKEKKRNLKIIISKGGIIYVL